MHNYIHIKEPLTQNIYFRAVIKWLAILLILGIVIFGLRSYVQYTYQKELKKYQPLVQATRESFRQSVEKSPLSSYELTLLGKKMLEANQTEWAMMVLEGATKKDPKYRDAALLTGYAYLRMAEEIRNSKSEIRNDLIIQQYNNLTIEQCNNLAIEYLNKAKDIDPIYSRTYELLALAYQNLGDSQNLESAYKKSVEFK